MRVIALISAYNEERYLATCLEHLFGHGVQAYLLNQESTDRTVEIAERYLGRGLIGIETASRAGGHDLPALLRRKEELSSTLDADWFMHMDPDEIRLPPRPNETLIEALERANAEGYNAVNFAEFVFLPTQESPDHEHANFERTMRWYYPFAPKFPHRLNAWKRQAKQVDLQRSAGHCVSFPGLRMSPELFSMRHYHFLNAAHAASKFVGRPYPKEDIEKGWHGWRAAIRPEMIALPLRHELSELTSDGELDPSGLKRDHYLGQLVSYHADKSKSKCFQFRSGADNSKPIPFIIGSGRCGTNLLSMMLDSHPDLAMVPETHFIPDLVTRCAASPRGAWIFVNFLTKLPRWPDFRIDEKELARRVTALNPFNLERALSIFYELYAARFGKTRWGEHTHAYGRNVDLIKQLFPGARLIHMIRDGRDVALSFRESYFGQDTMDKLAAHWVSRVKAALRAQNWVDYIEVRYEELVLNPEPTIKRVCQFIDLSYDPVMLNYHQRADERVAELRRDACDASRVFRWQREMSQSDLATVEAIAGDLLQQLGYKLSTQK